MSLTIQERARRGIPLTDCRIIDAHAHLGFCPIIHAAYGNAEGMVASMDSIGIQTTCISSFQVLGGDYREGNDRVAEAVKRYPSRFLGYATLNPNYPEDIERELARGLEELGLFAVKLHPTWHEYPPDGPAYHRVYAAMQERRGVVLSHTFGDPGMLESLASRYPNITFIVAHVAAVYDTKLAEALSLVLDRRPNIYLDMALSVARYDDLERWVEAVGAGRLLFGSDVPFNDNAHQIGRVTHATIPETEKRAILGGTMAEILRRSMQAL